MVSQAGRNAASDFTAAAGAETSAGTGGAFF
jgi:hypothetical protein